MTTPQLTDADIGRWYIKRRTDDTIAALGQWYRYKDGVWKDIHDLLIDRELWEIMEEFETRGQCRPTKNKKNSVLSRVQSQLFVPDEMIDANDDLINLANGVYDMQTGTLSAHDPKFYMTTQLPFNYDENATAPMWQLYLASTFVKPDTTESDPELINFLQEAMGYSLTTSVKYHATFWCSGEGNNGKGVLFHILEQLAGDGAISLNIGLLKREQYQLAMLAGKRIAMCSESDATQNLVEDALIKSLVAGDTMNVRMIKQRPFMLHPKCKLWWSMNSLPAVADSSHGFWRRVRLIPFNRVFTDQEKIVDLKSMLVTELPGIFNWVMVGLDRLRERGKFELPKQVSDRTELYKKESNPVAMFIEDECYIETDQSKAATMTAVYTSYKNWCFSNGYKAVASRRFKNEMLRMLHYTKKVAHGTIYVGLGLKI